MIEASIIIRTYNEEKHLGRLLESLREQDNQNHEVIIVDSGSVDGTVKIARDFGAKVIEIESQNFTFGYALNVGCAASLGKYLVFVSGHVIPENNSWLSNLLADFKNEKVAMVYGRQLGNEQSKFSERKDFERIFGPRERDFSLATNYANNANSAIRRDLWEKNNFDEYLFGLEDIAWAKQAVADGYLISYKPQAAVYHLHEEQWFQVFNRYRREAIAAVRIGLKHPPQARIGFWWPVVNTARDVLSSLPKLTLGRLEEILRFRYYQWKGTRQGWFYDRHLDFEREKDNIFRPIKNYGVVIKDKNWARYEEVDLPEMKPGDVLIRVDYVGVCRTDLEVYDGTLGYYRDGVAHYPIVPGHEFSGTIVRIGANNKFRERFKVGQRIVGECILSRRSSDRREVGVINHNGAYSQFVILPGNFIHRIPEGLDSQTATLTEPLAVILRALRRIRSRLFNGASIAVVGAGPIGNFCAQVLSLEGYEVTVFDKNIERLNLFSNKEIKTSVTIDKLEEFDFIIEATGSKSALEEVLKESQINSTILLLGFPYGNIDYNFEDLIGREKVIVGSVGADSEDFTRALELLTKLDTGHFVNAILPLSEFETAWKLHRASAQLKILLKP